MSLPTELCCIIIKVFAQANSRRDLMRLRLVNRNFDREILLYIFVDDEQDSKNRLVNQFSFLKAPPSLRRRYLQHRIARYPQEPSLFAHFFVPAMRLEMERLGIKESDWDARSALQNEWLHIPVEHAVADQITHQSKNFGSILSTIKMIQGPKDCPEPSITRWFESQVEYEWVMLRLCHAILKSEEETVSAILRKHPGEYYHQSRCFGINLLLFAVKRASIPVLKTVLHHHPNYAHHYHLNYVLSLTQYRDEDSYECIRTLLDLSSDIDPGFDIRHCIESALSTSETWLLENLLCWIRTRPNLENKQHILDESFLSAINHGRQEAMRLIRPHIDFSGTMEGLFPVRQALIAENRNLCILRYLLDNGADPNGAPLCGPSPIVIAVQFRQMLFVSLLLQRGADPSQRYCNLPLLYYSPNAKIEEQVSKLLKDNGWESELEEWERYQLVGNMRRE